MPDFLLSITIRNEDLVAPLTAPQNSKSYTNSRIHNFGEGHLTFSKKEKLSRIKFVWITELCIRVALLNKILWQMMIQMTYYLLWKLRRIHSRLKKIRSGYLGGRFWKLKNVKSEYSVNSATFGVIYNIFLLYLIYMFNIFAYSRNFEILSLHSIFVILI